MYIQILCVIVLPILRPARNFVLASNCQIPRFPAIGISYARLGNLTGYRRLWECALGYVPAAGPSHTVDYGMKSLLHDAAFWLAALLCHSDPTQTLDLSAGSRLLQLLRNGQDQHNGTQFAYKIADVDLTTAVPEHRELLRALQSGSMDDLFDTDRRVEFPMFGKCQLPPSPFLRTLRDSALTLYFVNLFRLLTQFRGPVCSAPCDHCNSALCVEMHLDISRFDLFHAHMCVNEDVRFLLSAQGAGHGTMARAWHHTPGSTGEW